MKILKINEYNSKISLTSQYWKSLTDLNNEYKDKFINIIEKILDAQPEEDLEDFESFPFGEGHIIQGVETGAGTYIFSVELNSPDLSEDEWELSEFSTDHLAQILDFLQKDSYIMNNLSAKYLKKINK